LIEDANLQLSKAQAISDKRAEAYRVIRQTYDEFRSKFDKTRKRLDDLGVQDASIRDLIAELTNAVVIGYANIERLGAAEPVATGV